MSRPGAAEPPGRQAASCRQRDVVTTMKAMVRDRMGDEALDRLRRARVTLRRLVGTEPRISVDRHMNLTLHGEPEYGWFLPDDLVQPDSVVVDVGVGEDVSFSRSLADRYGCPLHCVDPTPKALAYLDRLGDERLVIHPVGLGARTGPAEFHLPTDERHVSATAVPQEHTKGGSLQVELVDAAELRRRVGGRIDVLKLDIEGAEYEVIDSPAFEELAAELSVLCVEFHHRWPGVGAHATQRAAARLHQLGFDCVWRNPATNEEFTFVRRDAGSGQPTGR